MSTKKILLIVLAVGAVMLVVSLRFRVADKVQALPLAQKFNSPGVTIPYNGRLSDDAGQPVIEGAYDFTFALYDAADGGEALWSEVQEGIVVQEGAFVTSLGRVNPIPAEVLAGGEHWLETAVRGPKETDFTTLLPRQQLNTVSPAAPASSTAGPACPHDHWGESWDGTGSGLSLEPSTGGSGAQLISLFSGVYGYHDVFYGVLGQSKGAGIGVGGDSADRYGVWGHSKTSFGGWFDSDNDHLDLGLGGNIGRINASENVSSQLWLSSNADIVMRLDNNGGENSVFRIRNSGGSDVCTVDESGNLNCMGSKSAVVKTAAYGQRQLYAVESPEVWFEDFGSALLVEGKATVTVEPIFAETVNLEEAYHVFVTPLCQEPVLLFVTGKNDTGFSVQGVTLDGQPAQCAFEYRVVAKRLGYEDTRLKEVNWQEGE